MRCIDFGKTKAWDMQKLHLISFCLGIFTSLGIAQTTVTTNGGTQNKLPKFSGSSVLSDSAITELNGNVGIGTLNPGSPLTISNSASVKLELTGSTNQNGILFDTAGSADQYYIGSGYNLMVPGDQGFIILDAAANATKFFVNGSGNVSVPSGNFGVGTASPGARLDVVGTDADPQASGAQISTPTFPQLILNATTGGSDAKLWRMIGRGTNDFEIQTLNDQYAGEVTAMQINRNSTTINNVLFPNGNIGVGTMTPGAKLDVAGNIKLTASGSSITFPDNSIQSTAWNGMLGGGDYAESVDVSGNRAHYEPGDVLVIDPERPGKFLKSNEPYSTSVTGVYSTRPGVVGRRQAGAKNDEEVPMAMIGIVSVKVNTENGSIKPGDFLVTASIPGYAMKGTDRERMFGAVVGKALGNLEFGVGVIEVAISLQ